jgi:hypothetical protein
MAPVVAACLCWLLAATAAGQVKYWDLEPYRIHAVLAIDAPDSMADDLFATLPEYLTDRTETAIGPAWRLSTSVADGAMRHRLLAGLSTLSADAIAEHAADADKLVVLTVRATPLGYKLQGREYDFYVERWGATIDRQCPQRAVLSERLFLLLRETVAPLARLALDPDDEHRVVLQLRGAGLPHKGVAPCAEPGDVFLPILRRTTREGEVVPNGIQVVPWTYVQAMEVDDETIVGELLSGTRRPLGVRRRGRVEQVAIALRPELPETTVRLHSRTHPDKPLVGYPVFAQTPGEEATTPVGVSDSDGRLLEVPLPDDDVHQQAEARLAALREELIDVVARRNILMIRIRQKIEAGQLRQAAELLETLDDLPGRAQFNQTLAREARLHHSDDPQVQRRIDRLFAATQLVLGQFLDTRPINELHDELREAQQKSS